jgi:hypothetical protein
MTGDLPINDTFGNTLIRGIAEIHLPAPVPWTPSAPGWILLWGILLLTAIWVLYRLFSRWKRNAYRRRALGLLEKVKQRNSLGDKAALCALPRLLKSTALKAYPRSRVAPLSGEKWIAFLEDRCPDPGFRSHAGRHLTAISYEDPETWSFTQEQAVQVFSLVNRWIRCHRREGPP